jgi:hypothetical protein
MSSFSSNWAIMVYREKFLIGLNNICTIGNRLETNYPTLLILLRAYIRDVAFPLHFLRFI